MGVALMSGHHREQPGKGTSMCKGPVMGENMVYLRNRSTLSERKKGRGTKMGTDSKSKGKHGKEGYDIIQYTLPATVTPGLLSPIQYGWMNNPIQIQPRNWTQAAVRRQVNPMVGWKLHKLSPSSV